MSTAVWREKLDAIGVRDAVTILADNGVAVESLCAGGFLTEPGDAANQEAIDANRRLIDTAAEVGARTLVTITGGLPDGSRDLESARATARERLASLVPFAREAGVQLVLEPLHPIVCGYRSVITSLAEANDWLDEIDADETLGIALDSYAVWWEPDLEQQIARAGRRILNLHVSDWLRDTTDVRLDRGMPGDGCIDNRSIRRWVRSAGHIGPAEFEIFSERNWWKRDPDEVVQTIKARFEAFL